MTLSFFCIRYIYKEMTTSRYPLVIFEYAIFYLSFSRICIFYFIFGYQNENRSRFKCMSLLLLLSSRWFDIKRTRRNRVAYPRVIAQFGGKTVPQKIAEVARLTFFLRSTPSRRSSTHYIHLLLFCYII